MSIRSSLERSWSYRWLSRLPSPLPGSVLFKLPSSRILESFFLLGLALYLASAHGLWVAIPGTVITFGLIELFSVRPSAGIFLLVIAFAALPRIDPVLRTEDILVLALVLAALRKPASFQTPLDGAITVWIFSIGLSLAGGLAAGTIASPVPAAFTALKLVEYILAFYAAFLLRPRLELPLALALLILGALGLYDTLQGAVRPFDAFPYPAESNHVGGVGVLAAAFSFGGIIGKGGRRSWLVLLLAGLLVVLSQSRIALVAFSILLLLQLPHARTRPAAILCLLILTGFVLISPVQNRLRDSTLEWNTFRSTRQKVAEGLPPEFSLTRNRFEVWGLLAEDYARYPVLGTGPGSRNRVLYENTYAMLACELGAAGIAAFFLLILSVFFSLHRVAHSGPDPGIAYGAAFATAVMLILGLTSISFFLAREAGLWWILVGTALGRGAGNEIRKLPSKRATP